MLEKQDPGNGSVCTSRGPSAPETTFLPIVFFTLSGVCAAAYPSLGAMGLRLRVSCVPSLGGGVGARLGGCPLPGGYALAGMEPGV